MVCFTNACYAHDCCYGACDESRTNCDTAFHNDLLAACDEQFEPDEVAYKTCEGLAYIYWQVVVRFGQTAYELSCADAGKLPAAEQMSVLFVEPPFADADDDLLPDEWELYVGCDPNDPSDAFADPDGDGQVNLAEFLAGTWPTE